MGRDEDLNNKITLSSAKGALKSCASDENNTPVDKCRGLRRTEQSDYKYCKLNTAISSAGSANSQEQRCSVPGLSV